jgi:hypothetical protein
MLALKFVLLPQLAGMIAALSWRRRWVWPAIAAAAAAICWHVQWETQAQRIEAEGHRVCGAAALLWLLGLMFLPPVHALAAAGFQRLSRWIES